MKRNRREINSFWIIYASVWSLAGALQLQHSLSTAKLTQKERSKGVSSLFSFFSVSLSITCSGFFLLAAFAGGGACCCGCCCSWWFLCVFQMQYFSRKTAVIGWLHYVHFPFCNLDCHNLVLLLCWNKAAEINARVCVCHCLSFSCLQRDEATQQCRELSQELVNLREELGKLGHLGFMLSVCSV